MVDVTNKPSPTTPRTTGPQTQPDPRSTPGSDLYDWYTINDALRTSGLDGWQIAGSSHQPVSQGKWVANPDWSNTGVASADAALNEGKQQYIWQEGNSFAIGVVNPSTGQMLKLDLARQGDPKTGYSWSVTGRTDQGKIDTKQGGYTNVTRLPFADGHEELWGTNSSTGAFEKMSGAPDNLGNTKGWTDVKQIEQNGKLVWVGTNPQGQPLQPIPGSPTVDTAKYVPGSVKQVQVNGKLVYRGQNSQTQQWEDIPELGSENVPTKTTSAGGGIYVDNPKKGQPGEPDFIPASGIGQAQEGNTQWVDAGGGYVKQQIYSNGAWHDDPGTPQKAVSPTTQRAEGALKPKGEKYWVPLTGSPDTLVQVTADGNGGYTYEMGPNGEAPQTKRIPGIQQPTTVSGAGSDEFLPAQRDPITNQLLPPQRNPNWSPTNVGDRVRQLQDQARAKQADLHTQVVAGSLSEDDANKQFNDWWDTSIEPAKQEIQFAQQTKQQDLARQNLQVAQNAGAAVTTATAGEHRVGPGFGNVMANIQNSFATGKFPTPLSAQDLSSALVTPSPDYNKIYEQATAQALQHISPTAAQIATGQPIPTGGLPQSNMDVTSQLTPNRYVPGAPPAPPNAAQAVAPTAAAPAVVPVTAPSGAPATPTSPTTPMSPDAWAQLQARMAADRAEQLRQSQAQIPTTWNAWGTYAPPA